MTGLAESVDDFDQNIQNPNKAPIKLGLVAVSPTFEIANTPTQDDILPTVIAAGRIVYDHMRQELKIDDTFCSLSPTETRVLELLMTNRKRWLSTERIQELCWPASGMASSNVGFIIRCLRIKFGEELRNNIISKRGAGYRIMPDSSASDTESVAEL